MGVRIDDEQLAQGLRELAARRGMSEERVLGDLVRRELEAILADPTEIYSDEWRRETLEALEQYKASIPPEEREERQRQAAEFTDVVHGIQERVAAMPVLDPRSAVEIGRSLYDEDGLPR